jgi:hypothetical protein
MAKRDPARFMAYAKNVAAGMPPKDAYAAAGYSGTSSYYDTLFKQEHFQAEVERWRRKLRGGGSPDLGPIIDELMDGAQKALALNSGVGMQAACQMLTEAARLKQQLPREEHAPPRYEMTREEWLATFAPLANRT